MSKFKITLLLAAAVVLVAGFWRLTIDVNIFNLLPNGSPMVKGLQLYQRSFGASRDLILSVRTDNTESAEQATRSLAQELESSGLSPRIIWRNPLHESPAQIAELLAYLWYNQAPHDFEQVLGKLQSNKVRATVDSTLARMATSFRPMEIARLSRDPFALTDLPADVSSPMQSMRKDPFASQKGDFRILFASAPFENAGFWTYRGWVADVKEVIGRWQQEYAGKGPIRVRVTGTPAFVAETGTGLMRDMLTASFGTMVLVAGLFWLVYRRWLPLLWLISLLLLILVVTVSAGGLFIGRLNAVSLGFAAILLGLAADYGLILYQEYVNEPKRTVAQHRAALAPSILWAAVTTAGAFLLIGRSSLPGLTQLGILVGIGVLVAAATMLFVFLPPIVRHARRYPFSAMPAGTRKPPRVFKSRTIWVITLLAAFSAVIVLNHRMPAIDYGTKNLGPKVNPTKSALDEVQREIGGFDDVLWLIISGTDEREVADRLDRSAALLDGSVDEGLLADYTLPTALWPQPDHQRANRGITRRLSDTFGPARKVALDSGFTEDALHLTDEVFKSWQRFAASDGVAWPNQPGALWVMRQFAGQDKGRQLVLGKVEASERATQTDLLELAGRFGSITGGQLFGWSLLSESLMGIMKRDIKQVLIPMAVTLLILLGLAFRNVGQIFLSINTLGFSMLCLLGVMALLGWSWNLMNVMALPLLFGAGVDYSIHIQFALKRHGGDRQRVRRTVGRAILLCGASTASGFGTLGLASNAGVAGLGQVCAVGILIMSVTAVFLLPVWWQSLQKKTPETVPQNG